jgi:hypothetical protein
MRAAIKYLPSAEQRRLAAEVQGQAIIFLRRAIIFLLPAMERWRRAIIFPRRAAEILMPANIFLTRAIIKPEKLKIVFFNQILIF